MSKKINPAIDLLLAESGYDEVTNDFIRQLLNIELLYVNRSNYDATPEIKKLLDSYLVSEDD